ncbi:hypothetical protein LCGC14_1867050 [marine sediment metagenome]|uniref:Uncharacterized protein n=1 Tax=marine sediment metagenome TaxID=412755 RepID=A0A0F9J4U4_9ZZZZ
MNENVEKPYVQLSGKDGNVFAIIGRVRESLNKAGLRDKAKEFTKLAMSQHSYGDVLILCNEYCDVG